MSDPVIDEILSKQLGVTMLDAREVGRCEVWSSLGRGQIVGARKLCPEHPGL